MKAQLNAVFERMARPLVLQLELDQRPVSEELEAYMEELSSMTDKPECSTVSDTGEKNLPVVRVCAQMVRQQVLRSMVFPADMSSLRLFLASTTLQVLASQLVTRIRHPLPPSSQKHICRSW